MSADPLDESKRSFLVSLLQVILTKMKWDEQPDLDDADADEDDIAEFEKMRKVSQISFNSEVIMGSIEKASGSARLSRLHSFHRSRSCY